MKTQEISEGFTVGEQISPDDVAVLADAGFDAVICNRPDGEEPGQPPAVDIAAACERHGIDFHHLPFASADIDPSLVEAFRNVLDGAKGPVFAYCRSGQRCAYIWQMAKR